MDRRLGFVLAAGLASAALPSSARAANHVFEACDGRKAPGDRDGGMADPVSSAGMPSETAVVFNDSVKDGGGLVGDCTRALTDDRLGPAMGLRRAHLLRARSLAQLANGDADAAIADLDAAMAAAGPLGDDPLYARSMGVSLALIRAAALDLKGEHEQAIALAARAGAGRPYSVAVQTAAAVIERHALDAVGRDASDAFAALLPLDPNARQLQFSSEMAAGRFEKALTLYDRLDRRGSPDAAATSADLPSLLGSISNDIDASYAYAAIGQASRARALLATVRGHLALAFAPAAAPSGDRNAALRAQLAQRLSGPLTAVVDERGTMIGARASIVEGHPMDALKSLVGVSLPVSASAIDLLVSLRAALSDDQRALAPDPAILAAKLAEQRRAEKLDVALLRRAMPAPETERSVAGYGKASPGFLSGLLPVVFSSDGFTSRADPATDITTVEFTGRATSAPVVDELTLLRAADLARTAGRSGLVILSRHDYARTMNTYSGYGHTLLATSPAGFKTVLGVRFVDPAALPADLAGQADRVLDADRLYAALAPVYKKR